MEYVDGKFLVKVLPLLKKWTIFQQASSKLKCIFLTFLIIDSLAINIKHQQLDVQKFILLNKS